MATILKNFKALRNGSTKFVLIHDILINYLGALYVVLIKYYS